MTVITRSRTENYAVVPNSVTEDSRLSFEARGVLCYLLAKPNNWQVQIADIQRQGSFGRDKAYRILKELREVGYLTLEVKRNDKAQIISQDYVVYDVADVSKNLLPENTEMDIIPDLLPEKPDTAEPDTANTDGIISKDNITNTHSFSDTNVSSKQKAREAKKQFEAEFNQNFWPAYPHKVGKQDAFKAFLKARTDSPLQEIMGGLDRYIKTKEGWRHWMHPATFLNQERWNDQPATISEQHHASGNSQPKSPGRKFSEAVFDLCNRQGLDPFKPIIGGDVSTDFQGWDETERRADSEDPFNDRGGPCLALVANNTR